MGPRNRGKSRQNRIDNKARIHSNGAISVFYEPSLVKAVFTDASSHLRGPGSDETALDAAQPPQAVTSNVGGPVVHFVVTGFGPFQGVASNPTTELVPLLAAATFSPSVIIHATQVLETSAAGSTEGLALLHSGMQSPIPTVFLHFGVNSSATEFALEQTAHNDATFCVPDERGLQLAGEKIIADDDIRGRRVTKLDVPQLITRVKSRNPFYAVRLSDDPGRFICNYTYYASLARTDASLNQTSLFCHVPPFTAVPKDLQLAFARDLIESIAAHVLESSEKLERVCGVLPPLASPTSTVATISGTPDAATVPIPFSLFLLQSGLVRTELVQRLQTLQNGDSGESGAWHGPRKSGSTVLSWQLPVALEAHRSMEESNPALLTAWVDQGEPIIVLKCPTLTEMYKASLAIPTQLCPTYCGCLDLVVCQAWVWRPCKSCWHSSLLHSRRWKDASRCRFSYCDEFGSSGRVAVWPNHGPFEAVVREARQNEPIHNRFEVCPHTLPPIRNLRFLPRATLMSVDDSAGFPVIQQNVSTLCCPACEEPYGAPPDEAAAVSLSCGHSFCKLCGDAMVASATPACMACGQSVFPTILYNHAVAALVESLSAVTSSPKTPKIDDALPVSARQGIREPQQGGSFMDGLHCLMKDCVNGATAATQTANSLHSTQARMTERFNLSKTRLLEAVESIKASIDAKCRDLLVEATRAHDSKAKALQCQQECAIITAGQLLATADACRLAMEQQAPKMMSDILAHGDQARKLLHMPTDPGTSTLIEVVPSEWVQTLEAVDIGVVRHGLVTNSRISGAFLSAFVSGDGLPANTGTIELIDDHGFPVLATEADVNVRIQPIVDPDFDDVSMNESDRSGVTLNKLLLREGSLNLLDVEFTVHDSTVTTIEVLVAAFGLELFRERISSGLQARGGLVRTLRPSRPQPVVDNSQPLLSFAVNENATQLAAIFHRCQSVFVYSLPACELLHNFGEGDTIGNLRLIQPVYVSAVPGTSHWLVCDNGGHRVIEVNNAGGLVTCFLVNMPTAAVSDGKSVVVARQPVNLPNYNTLELYSNGHFVNAFEWYGLVSSLAILPPHHQLDVILPGFDLQARHGTAFLLDDNSLVVVSNHRTRQSSADLEVVSLGAVVTSLSQVASLEQHGESTEVIVRECCSGSIVRRWLATPSVLEYAPPQLLSAANQLYVSDQKEGVIKVFV